MLRVKAYWRDSLNRLLPELRASLLHVTLPFNWTQGRRCSGCVQGPPVYNRLQCLRPIFHLLFRSNRTVVDSEGRGTFSPSLSLCCSFSDASQCAINLLLIRLKHLSQKQEAALLCLERGPNKSSNWQVNLTALPPTPLDSFLSRNYHFAPTAQVWGDGGGE